MTVETHMNWEGNNLFCQKKYFSEMVHVLLSPHTSCDSSVCSFILRWMICYHYKISVMSIHAKTCRYFKWLSFRLSSPSDSKLHIDVIYLLCPAEVFWCGCSHWCERPLDGNLSTQKMWLKGCKWLGFSLQLRPYCGCTSQRRSGWI